MTTHGTYDLYHALPATPSTAQALPEAAFSLTLRGTLAGQDALLTIRGATIGEFQANVAAVRGLLDAAQPAPAPVTPGEGWCPKHGVQMQPQQKEGRQWFSHKIDGQWCKGK
jgi:hypothetical protein